MHKDGGGWKLFHQSPTASDLYSVFGFSAIDVWAGGDALYHYDGNTWTAAYKPPSGTQFFSIWGGAPDDVWAAGLSDDLSCKQVFVHWDGTSWARQPAVEGLNVALDQITGSAVNDVWAAASGYGCGPTGLNLGQLLHWDGKSWMSASLPPGLMATNVLEPSPGDVWIVGYDPAECSANGCLVSHVWHGKVGDWAQEPLLVADGAVVSMFGSSSSDVWIVVPENNPYHFDGTSWVQPQLLPSVSAWGFSAGSSVSSKASYLVGLLVQRRRDEINSSSCWISRKLRVKRCPDLDATSTAVH
jgi:hypothetical protein